MPVEAAMEDYSWRLLVADVVRDAIYRILWPLKNRYNISGKEAERIEDDVAESILSEMRLDRCTHLSSDDLSAIQRRVTSKVDHHLHRGSGCHQQTDVRRDEPRHERDLPRRDRGEPRRDCEEPRRERVAAAAACPHAEELRRREAATAQAFAELVCPITLSLPFEPVIADDGTVYERSAIEKWLGQQGRSPSTNLPMGSRLLPALHVKNMIRTMVTSGTLTGDKADEWELRWKEAEQAAAEKAAAEKAAVAADALALALARAAMFGDVEAVRAHLLAGVAVDVVTYGRVGCTRDKRGGCTALMRAARRGHVACLRVLLEGKADPNMITEGGRTALAYSARCDQEGCLRALLAAGAVVDARDGYGQTALVHAARGGHEPCLRALLQGGAVVDAQDNEGWTALMWAAHDGHERLALVLLEKMREVGSAVDESEEDGWTALMFAAQAGHEQLADRLLTAGADVSARDAKTGQTVLMAAAEGGHERVAERLLTAGADVGARDRTGQTAMLYAARGGHEPCLRALLLHGGADVDAMDAMA